MALKFISGWLTPQHSNTDLIEPVINVEPGAVPQDCDAEEEDDICWFLGKIIFYYCLAVSVIKIIYLAIDRIRMQKCDLISCKIVKSAKGCRECDCECHIKSNVCSFLRKLFGGKACVCREVPASYRSLKKALKKCLSRFSQQTFRTSDSSDSETFVSQVSSWKGSKTRTEKSRSVSSQRSKRAKKRSKSPEEGWIRAQPCAHCKAKRTREWLAQHFFDQD
ncbi:serine-rich single-pass membrane protein 1 [Sceloporus undulatus]|uniref:serine-rich single-pass membrane protein 1 n=1 Tax=Sceloporus undulatus TaxID=8520 RepID=UPI001C4B3A25|nr:serine-rich single-pass membrane protein 1 [Sceloporus undulatus]XP_042325748.1 serine-rich single-pass membrane protein 1 [Sceloporus undulatus]